jgi:putative inorganic carbon (hco3(-)) transporter
MDNLSRNTRIDNETSFSSGSFLQRLARAVITWEWLWLALIFPFILFPTPARSLILIVLPLLWLVRRFAHGHFIPPTPLNSAVLLLLITVLVSLYATFDLAFSLAKLAGLLFGIALFFAVTAFAARSSRRYWLALLVYLGTGFVMAVFSLLGMRWSSAKIPGVNLLLAQLPGQVVSLPGAESGFSANQVAGALLWLIPVALMLLLTLLLRPRRLWRELPGWSWLTLFFLAGLSGTGLTIILILTQSRSGLAGLFASWLGMFGLFALTYRRWGALMIISFIIVVVAVANYFPLAPLQSLISQRLATPNLRDWRETLESLEGRTLIWSRALAGTGDFAYTGMGLGTFRQNVRSFYPLFDHNRPDSEIAHAHNQWLQTAVDLGIPGLVAYLALWLLALMLIGQIWRHASMIWARGLSLGFLGSLAGYFTFGLTDTVALGAKPGFLFWFLLGLIVALHQLVAVKQPDQIQ